MTTATLACESYVRTQQLQRVDVEADSDEFKDYKALGSEVKKGFKRYQENRQDRKKTPKEYKKIPNNSDKTFTELDAFLELSEQEAMDFLQKLKLREYSALNVDENHLLTAAITVVPGAMALPLVVRFVVCFLFRFTRGDDPVEVKSKEAKDALYEVAAKRTPHIPNEIVDIISKYAGESPLFRFKDGTRSFEEMSLEDSRLIYRSELETAVNTGNEPTYLKTILDERASKIATLIEAKETGLHTRDEWMRHVRNILVVMYASNSLAWHETAYVARNAASNAAWNAARNAALSAAREAIGNAAWYGAWDAVYYAWNGAWNAAWNAAHGARKAFDENELDYLKLTSPEKIGKYAYRIAEKAVLIYFLQNEQESFNAVYQASNNLVLPLHHFDSPEPRKSFLEKHFGKLIDSPETWKNFREKHFGKLKPEQYQFLRPYLEAIDRIVTEKLAK